MWQSEAQTPRLKSGNCTAGARARNEGGDASRWCETILRCSVGDAGVACAVGVVVREVVVKECGPQAADERDRRQQQQ